MVRLPLEILHLLEWFRTSNFTQVFLIFWYFLQVFGDEWFMILEWFMIHEATCSQNLGRNIDRASRKLFSFLAAHPVPLRSLGVCVAINGSWCYTGRPRCNRQIRQCHWGPSSTEKNPAALMLEPEPLEIEVGTNLMMHSPTRHNQTI